MMNIHIVTTDPSDVQLIAAAQEILDNGHKLIASPEDKNLDLILVQVQPKRPLIELVGCCRIHTNHYSGWENFLYRRFFK